MSTKDIWNSFGHWLRAIDDTLHDDPTEALTRRVEHLEARLEKIQCPASGSSS
ncbi:MAG: hypothetical protein AAGF81_21185 [Pseudomonadota bacterium]